MNLDFLKGLVPCGTSYANHACTVCDFFVLIQNIINFILFIFASLATLMVIYIAFLFMFSGGSPAKITDAKGKLWLVIIGIFWVLGSWLVLNTVLNFIVDKSVFPWPWNKINCSVSQSSSAPGGTELGHAQGTFSHASGNKLDFSSNSALDQYIQNNFKYAGLRSDGAKQYTAPDGTIMAREGDHWDATLIRL